MAFRIRSEAFEDGARIPRVYTQDGANVSPPLAIENAPPSAAEFALLVEDPDAPGDAPYVHWTLYALHRELDRVPEGLVRDEEPRTLEGSRQGKNSAGRTGYDGPAPPRNDGPHRYRFRLFALEAPLGLAPTAAPDEVRRALEGRVLAEACLEGTYGR